MISWFNNFSIIWLCASNNLDILSRFSPIPSPFVDSNNFDKSWYNLFWVKSKTSWVVSSACGSDLVFSSSVFSSSSLSWLSLFSVTCGNWYAVFVSVGLE